MSFNPTEEQRKILSAGGNIVVIANPGSGKTSTLALLIQKRLARLPEFRGVIAISYTNKASEELKNRSLEGGRDKKGSFFGTIDRFFLTEILFPFGERVLGRPVRDLQVATMEDIGLRHRVGWTEGDLQSALHVAEVFPVLRDLFLEGTILLEGVGLLGLYVYQKSRACRRYLRARYTDVVIDEYQDCGYWQHEMFLVLCAAGIRAIAVGDLNQSIFDFAHKSPKYLHALTEADGFETFLLSINHRSHPSIVGYSTKLILPQSIVEVPDDPRVYWKEISGHEGQIGEWLARAIPAATRKFSNGPLSETAILTRNNRTAALVQAALSLPNKLFVTTPLDTNGTPSANILKGILLWLFNAKITRTELIEEALAGQGTRAQRRRIVLLLVDLEDAVAEGFHVLRECVDVFAALGTEFHGRSLSRRALAELEEVLRDEAFLQSYIPAQREQVQILTIYKAKGQEYDHVFHLDMYNGVLPYSVRSIPQDRNLHYVGLTRARHACVLVTSTHRHTNSGTVRADRSTFMMRDDLRVLAKVMT